MWRIQLTVLDGDLFLSPPKILLLRVFLFNRKAIQSTTKNLLILLENLIRLRFLETLFVVDAETLFLTYKIIRI